MAEPTKATPKKAAPSKVVTVRVLKKGAGKISTGERKDNKDVKRVKGDKFKMDRVPAEVLEDRGFVEIED